jgi:hypothetical protein
MIEALPKDMKDSLSFFCHVSYYTDVLKELLSMTTLIKEKLDTKTFDYYDKIYPTVRGYYFSNHTAQWEITCWVDDYICNNIQVAKRYAAEAATCSSYSSHISSPLDQSMQRTSAYLDHLQSELDF